MLDDVVSPSPVETIATKRQPQQPPATFMTWYIWPHFQTDTALQSYRDQVHCGFDQLQEEVGNDTSGMAANMVGQGDQNLKDALELISGCIDQIHQDDANLTFAYNEQKKEMAAVTRYFISLQKKRRGR